MGRVKIFLLAILSLLVFPSCAQQDADSGPKRIGGQRDEHGCLVGAGYSWCEAKQKCIRPWEESCEEDDGIDEKKSCQNDNDCIPLPSECHPHSCINKKFRSEYAPPEVCTELYDCSAAYEQEDCLCQKGECANGNRGKTCN